ncbi:tripartite tricarboxylate transporter substrate binding protein [Bacillus sp. FJAT-44742]|uniref:tripartite tricarboxylate transporter substrate binding protein n=1 Tax=Bacillus sp. FJAT-44742 TaxID=2014005 RepID=UPI000C23EA1F|nr:tripartite tricarboxylate transporter substrate binding protein [Bacillus sp. FJAT-44742]
MKLVSFKTLLLVLVFSLVTFLAACGNGADETGGEEQGNGEEDTNSEDAANASGYPESSIEVVVPAGAGGDTDRNTRTLARHLEDELGVNLVVQNVEGSGGSVGSREVMQGNADGYKALAFHDSALINSILGLTEYSHQDFELAGISVQDQGNAFVVSADSQFEDLDDLVEYARENPGEVSVATETGAFTHLQLLALEEEAGIEFRIVDAGGASDKITALLGGQVDVVPTQLGLVDEYLEADEMRSVGVLSEERLDQFPEEETFVEQGYDIVFNKNFFWAFPPETPEDVVNTFADAMETVIEENEDYRGEAEGHGVTPNFMGPEEAEQHLNEEKDYYQSIYEASGE